MEDLIEYSLEQQIIFAMLRTDRQTDLLHNVVIDNTSNRVHLESIEAQKVIRIDGLTKDRLFDVMTQVRDGFAFVMLQFQKHNFWPPSFDPSQLP